MQSIRFLVLCALACAWALAQAPPKDPKQRVRAARELGNQGADAIPKLQAMLSDPATEVRIEAVKSIVTIDTAASLDPLVQATRDNDPEVQIRATDGLVNFYAPGYVRRGLSSSFRRVGDAVKAVFTDTNDQVIDSFIQVRPDVVEALGRLVRGGSSMASRVSAARAVGILRSKAAIPDLVEALHSKDDPLMYESLIALQKIGDPEAGPRVEFLLRDLDERIQVAAIDTVGLLRDRGALPQLRAILDDARTMKVKRAALTSIAMIPDPASHPLYIKYLSDRDDGLRAAATEGLARLKNPVDLPVIEKIYNGEQRRPTQLAGAFALVSLGKVEVAQLSPLQFLIDTLNSSAWRGVARAYLVELTRDPAVRRAAQEATRKGTREEKIELAQILAVSGDKETVPYLDALAHDNDTDVAQAGLNALRTLKARLP